MRFGVAFPLTSFSPSLMKIFLLRSQDFPGEIFLLLIDGALLDEGEIVVSRYSHWSGGPR